MMQVMMRMMSMKKMVRMNIGMMTMQTRRSGSVGIERIIIEAVIIPTIMNGRMMM